MQISLQALSKKPPAKTFTLQVSMGGKCGIALVDSGSSHTFVDTNFIVKTSCPTVNNPLETVVVAGGGTLQTGSHTVDTPYTIQGHKFNNSFRVLPLKGFVIILGCDWLEKHNPITMDFITRKMQVLVDGKTKVTLKDNNRRGTVPLISLNRMEKLSSTRVSGYCLFPLSPNKQQTQQPCAEIEDILHEYKDVFEEPKQMHPMRECDHAIPLKEGSEPPMLRPYRVPHMQKTEMEKKIKELLDASVIRPSKSPYAAPIILVK